MTIRVLLADDHAMFRQALCALLEKEKDIRVVGEVGDGPGAVALSTKLRPDIVVMDVSMPGQNGIAATRDLCAQLPGLRVIALSAYADKRYVLEMLSAGATGYVVKAAAGDELVRALRVVARGETYLCPEVSAALVDSLRRRTGRRTLERAPGRLGQREIEVLRLLAEGRTSPQIARSLHIAASTVEVHRRNIMRKLDLHSVAELTKYAIREGLTGV